ncbi:MAG: dihydropteroate synthase [Deltaproteobacteria bacterium]|nr:dihydropteroate synthase [Deltaproteobacteria bacterium]
MLIIGERINSSRTSIAQAISAQDVQFIQDEAKAQADAGADYIDVNAGTFIKDECEKLKWVADTVQAATDLPLCIDSPVNSITLEPARLEGILPLVAEHGTKVIGLCQSESEMAESKDDKMRLAEQLVKHVTDAGVPLDDLYIDPLVYPLATNTESALATLSAIKGIMKEFPGVHTTCGLTNVSYGLPNRKLVNQTFLISAITQGLDSAIMDPTNKRLYGALKAALMVMGQDDFCMNYVGAFREERLE